MLAIAPIVFEVRDPERPGRTWTVSTPTDGSGARCDCEDFTGCCEHTHAVVSAASTRLFDLAQVLAQSFVEEDAERAAEDDELHVYQRAITAEFTSRWPIDQNDLDEAVRLALEALALRVEGAETLELLVCEVRVRAITRP